MFTPAMSSRQMTPPHNIWSAPRTLRTRSASKDTTLV